MLKFSAGAFVGVLAFIAGTLFACYQIIDFLEAITDAEDLRDLTCEK